MAFSSDLFSTPNRVLLCGILGLVIPLWVIAGYTADEDIRAILIIVLIMMGFGFGIYELWREARDIALLGRDLAAVPPVEFEGESVLGRLSPALRELVQLRLSGAAQARRGQVSYTPYLIGALILLGLIGTFIGLVETLSGTRAALRTTADLDALRSSLLAPIAGLARAFGASVSGVATSVMLGLAATLTRRDDSHLDQRIAGLAATRCRSLMPSERQTVALERLVEQGSTVSEVVQRFQEAVSVLIRMQEDLRHGHDTLAVQVANAISERSAAIRDDLNRTLQRFSDEIEPAVKSILSHTAGVLNDAGRNLVSRVQDRFETTMEQDREQRGEVLKLIEAERQVRSAEEVKHFEGLAAHARGLAESFQSQVDTIGRHYERYLERLEGHVANFDKTWKQDNESRRQESEVQRQALEAQLASLRSSFIEQSELLSQRHRELLQQISKHYQDLVQQFSQQATALTDQASEVIAALSHKYTETVDRHEDDRAQLRKAWGVEQGRQQRQFDSMLQQMREDLEDRRRSDTEQITSLNAWAQQLVKRIELGVADKAVGWDAQFSKLIGALAETAQALHYGERARIKEFKEIVQVISEADQHRGDEFRRLVLTLRESGEKTEA
ncbi:MAG: hypothetical protein ACREWG_02670 [Gammaproteobacteria bacterium]